MDTGLSEISSDFNREGYVVVKNLISESEADSLRSVCERIDWRTGSRHPQAGVQTVFDRRGHPTMSKISGLSFYDEVFVKVAHKPAIVSILRTIFAEEARLFRDVVVIKPAVTGGRLSPHQDSAYWAVDPPSLVSVWIALTDVDQDMSPLQVVPRSHLLGVVPHHSYLSRGIRTPRLILRLLQAFARQGGTGDNPELTATHRWIWKLKRAVISRGTRIFPLIFRISDLSVDSSLVTDPVSLPIRKGDAVFFHSCLIHGTMPNVSPRDRHAVIISYMPVGALYDGRASVDFPVAGSL